MIAETIPLSTILSPSLAVYRFPGNWGTDSRCGVRAVTLYDRLTVILSELPDNPGTPITVRVEMIATLLSAERFAGQEPTVLRWVEHYPPDDRKFPQETFDWIEFDYNRAMRTYTNARRRRFTTAEVEDLRAVLIQEAH